MSLLQKLGQDVLIFSMKKQQTKTIKMIKFAVISHLGYCMVFGGRVSLNNICCILSNQWFWSQIPGFTHPHTYTLPQLP